MGRRAHIGEQDFSTFMESVPEGLTNQGYWKIQREYVNPKTGGVLNSTLGFIGFSPGEPFEQLRLRVKELADKAGPGTFYALACDDHKKEVPNIGKPKFEFTEDDVETPGGSENTLSDTVKTIKKTSKDLMELQNLQLQKQMIEKAFGVKPEKDEESVKESNTSGSLNELMMMQMLMGGDKKKESGPDPLVQEKLLEAKLNSAMAEVKAQIATMAAQATPKVDPAVSELKELVKELVRANSQPKEDSETKAILAQLVAERSQSKQENAFQSMMALMVKQQEEERRQRADDEKRREQERKEELRRQEEERKEERRRLDEENRRREELRREEQRRAEELAKLEREKFEKELAEQRRRFDEELKFRREELKHDDAQAKIAAVEQQKMQFELLNLFKNNKDSSLETTGKIIEAMTTAGLGSMKTAQEAATTIMEVAKSAHHGKDKEEKGGGFAEALKDIGQIAAPLLAPYADADAKLKMVEAAAKMNAAARKRPSAPAPKPAPAQTEAQTPVDSTLGETTETPGKEEANMIAQLLKQQPELKDALVGNLKDKLGVEMFVDSVIDLCDQAGIAKGVAGLIGGMDHKKMMQYLSPVMNEEEKKVIAENEEWFKQLRVAMREEYNRIKAEEAEDAADEVSQAK